MYKLVISLKYLRGRLITMCSILFVATGVMALIVVNSVMGGFQKEFKARLRGTLSHMTVRLSSAQEYDHYAKIVAATEHVAAVAPHKEGFVLLAWQGIVQPCKVLGIDPEKEYEVSNLKNYLMTPVRDLREDLLQVVERRTLKVEWVLDAVDTDAKGRRRAYFRERAQDTATSGGAVHEWQQAVAFGEKGLVIHREIKVSNGIPEEAQRAGEEYDRCAEWFRGVNADLVARRTDEVVARFSPQLTRNTPYLDLAKPFLLRGGRIEHEEPGILVGHELFRGLGLRLGDKVELITAKVKDNTDPNAAKDEKDFEKKGKLFVVTGSFKTGMNEYDSNFIYAPYAEIVTFLEGSRDNSISIALSNHELADQVRTALAPKLKVGMHVETWQDKRKNLLKAVDMERAVMFVIMFFFILFAVVTIAVILILLVVEKFRDIGILKSMGASSWGIATIFVTNGLVAGTIGCALGAAAGVAIATHVNEIADVLYEYTGFRVFPRDVYYLDRIPSDVDPAWIASTVAIALGLCFLCCLAPAYQAGRLQVVDTLKWE